MNKEKLRVNITIGIFLALLASMIVVSIFIMRSSKTENQDTLSSTTLNSSEPKNSNNTMGAIRFTEYDRIENGGYVLKAEPYEDLSGFHVDVRGEVSGDYAKGDKIFIFAETKANTYSPVDVMQVGIIESSSKKYIGMDLKELEFFNETPFLLNGDGAYDAKNKKLLIVSEKRLVEKYSEVPKELNIDDIERKAIVSVEFDPKDIEAINSKNTDPSTSSSTSVAPPASSSQVPKVPSEYLSALDKAREYIGANIGLSKLGLHNQLVTFEKFPTEAAQYAIDNISADWNKQALIKAKSYLKLSMSKQAIYDQMVSQFEQFTPEQAQYAIDNLPK